MPWQQVQRALERALGLCAPQYTEAENATLACSEAWDQVLCSEEPVPALKAALAVPSVCWRLGLPRPAWPRLISALASGRASSDTDAAETLVSKQVFTDVITTFVSELGTQQARCRLYRALTLRLLATLAVIGLLTIFLRGWVSALALPALVTLGPAAGILVVLEMEETGLLRERWIIPPPTEITPKSQPSTTTPASDSQTQLPLSQRALAQLRQGWQDLAGRARKLLTSGADMSCHGGSRSLTRPSDPAAYFSISSKVHELLARPADQLTESDVLPYYLKLTGEELLATLKADQELETNVAPLAEDGSDRASGLIDEGDDVLRSYPGTTHVSGEQLSGLYAGVGAGTGGARQRKWSVEIVQPTQPPSSRISACGSFSIFNRSTGPTCRGSMQSQSGTLPAPAPAGNGGAPYGGLPPWLIPRPQVGVATNPAPSVTQSNDAGPVPPWLRPVSYEQRAASYEPRASSVSLTGRAAPGAASSPLPQLAGTPPARPSAEEYARRDSVASSSAGTRRSLPSALLERISTTLSLAGLRHRTSLSRGSPPPLPPDSHRLDKRGRRAAEKARRRATAEARLQLHKRELASQIESSKRRVLTRLDVPGLTYIENAPPDASAASDGADRCDAGSSAGGSDELDWGDPAALAELHAGLEIMSQRTMIGLAGSGPASQGKTLSGPASRQQTANGLGTSCAASRTDSPGVTTTTEDGLWAPVSSLRRALSKGFAASHSGLGKSTEQVDAGVKKEGKLQRFAERVKGMLSESQKRAGSAAGQQGDAAGHGRTMGLTNGHTNGGAAGHTNGQTAPQAGPKAHDAPSKVDATGPVSQSNGSPVGQQAVKATGLANSGLVGTAVQQKQQPQPIVQPKGHSWDVATGSAYATADPCGALDALPLPPSLSEPPHSATEASDAGSPGPRDGGDAAGASGRAERSLAERAVHKVNKMLAKALHAGSRKP